MKTRSIREGFTSNFVLKTGKQLLRDVKPKWKNKFIIFPHWAFITFAYKGKTLFKESAITFWWDFPFHSSWINKVFLFSSIVESRITFFPQQWRNGTRNRERRDRHHHQFHLSILRSGSNLTWWIKGFYSSDPPQHTPMVCVADRSFVVSDSPDNVSSPYYLRWSSGSGSTLNGSNYAGLCICWLKRSFIDGSLPRPSLDDLIISYKIWVRCKSMAKSWIMNTRDISILYMQDTATEEIKEKRL